MAALLLALLTLIMLSLFGCAGRIRLLRRQRRKLVTEINDLQPRLIAKKQRFTEELDQWFQKEQHHRQFFLQADMEEQTRLAQHEIRLYRQQQLTQVKAEVAASRKTAIKKLDKWVKKKKNQLEEQTQAEYEEHKQPLEEALSLLRKKRINQLHAELATREQTAKVKFNAWVMEEKTRTQEKLKAETSLLKQSVKQEVENYRQQRLAALDAELAAKKSMIHSKSPLPLPCHQHNLGDQTSSDKRERKTYLFVR